MDKKALKALEGSIRKWERIVQAKGKDNGRDNCPLCKLYYDEDCEGCPVMKKIGSGCCEGTPYSDWSVHHNDKHPDKIPYKVELDCARCNLLAEKELRFLRSLLPKKKESV